MKKIRKKYALDVEFIAQYYFPQATIVSYTSHLSPMGNTVFFVNFLSSYTAYAKECLKDSYFKDKLNVISPRPIWCIDPSWGEEGDYFKFVDVFRGFLNPLYDKAFREFVSEET